MPYQLTTTQIVIIAAILLVELALLVAAWIVLFRTPSARLTLPKWAWAVICLLQFIGPIAFFAVGRKPRPVEESGPRPDAATTTSRVVDDLYGDR